MSNISWQLGLDHTKFGVTAGICVCTHAAFAVLKLGRNLGCCLTGTPTTFQADDSEVVKVEDLLSIGV